MRNVLPNEENVKYLKFWFEKNLFEKYRINHTKYNYFLRTIDQLRFQ